MQLQKTWTIEPFAMNGNIFDNFTYPLDIKLFAYMVELCKVLPVIVDEVPNIEVTYICTDYFVISPKLMKRFT
jgi:hypothetical protein